MDVQTQEETTVDETAGAGEEIAFEVGLPPVELSVAAQIESLLFVADDAVAIADLVRVLELSRARILQALDALESDARHRGLRLQRGDNRVRLVTAPEAADIVQRFLGLEHAQRLSRAALETLSIVAYRQPLTRPEIDDLRGVSSDGVLRTLLARELIEPLGRRETVGHPVEYGTTGRFLEYFGLAALDELPPIDLPSDAEDAPGETAEWAPFRGGRQEADALAIVQEPVDASTAA